MQKLEGSFTSHVHPQGNWLHIDPTWPLSPGQQLHAAASAAASAVAPAAVVVAPVAAAAPALGPVVLQRQGQRGNLTSLAEKKKVFFLKVLNMLNRSVFTEVHRINY